MAATGGRVFRGYSSFSASSVTLTWSVFPSGRATASAPVGPSETESAAGALEAALGPKHGKDSKGLCGLSAFGRQMALIAPLGGHIAAAGFAGDILQIDGNRELIGHATVPGNSRGEQAGRERRFAAANDGRVGRFVPSQVFLCVQ